MTAAVIELVRDEAPLYDEHLRAEASGRVLCHKRSTRGVVCWVIADRVPQGFRPVGRLDPVVSGGEAA